MLLGVSVPAKDPLGSADRVGADCVQLHLSAPRAWRHPVGRADADVLAASGRVVAAHAPYLCNPASGSDEVREKTAANLQATLDEAAACGVGGVVVHAGHAAGGGDLDDALDRWVEVVRRLSSPVPLLIENTATGATAPGRHLADVEQLYSRLRQADLDVPIGACFDTCHAWAGDPACAEDPAGYVARYAEAVGGVDLLHVNDSRDEAGAGRDRHANLDAGRMGPDVLGAMVRACAQLGVPAAILETPSKDRGHERDLAVLRDLLGAA